MQRVFLVDFDDPSLAFEVRDSELEAVERTVVQVEVGECVEVFAEYGGLQRNDNRVWVCRVVEIRSVRSPQNLPNRISVCMSERGVYRPVVLRR